MSPSDTQAIVTLSLMAAFADGSKHDRERQEVKRIADGLAHARAVHLPTLVQDVLMKRIDLAQAGGRPRFGRTPASSPTKWRCACATPTACSRCPSSASWPNCGRRCKLDDASTRQFTDDAQTLAAAPLEGPLPDAGVRAAPSPVQPAGGRPSTLPERRARPDDPERRDHQRRAGTAARVAVDAGHHSAADAAGLSHRPVVRLRTGPGPRQGLPGHDRRGPDLAVPGAGRPQAAGRAAGPGRRRAAGRARAPGREFGHELRGHLCAGPRRPALLRRRTHAVLADAQGGLCRHRQRSRRTCRRATCRRCSSRRARWTRAR